MKYIFNTNDITPDAITRMKTARDDVTQDICYLQRNMDRSKKEIKTRAIIGILGSIGFGTVYFIDNHYFNGQLTKMNTNYIWVYATTVGACSTGLVAVLKISDFFRDRKNKNGLSVVVDDATKEISRLEEMLNPLLDSEEWKQITTEHTTKTQVISDGLATLQRERENTILTYNNAFQELIKKHYPNSVEELTYKYIKREW